MSGRNVVLATENAERISLRKPDAVVIDVLRQVIWQAGEPWHVNGLGHRKTPFRYVRGTLNFRFHVMMICGQGRLISYDEIYSEFWGRSENGGPLDTARYVSVLRCRAAPLFAWIGLNVETRHGLGFNPSFNQPPALSVSAPVPTTALYSPLDVLQPRSIGGNLQVSQVSFAHQNNPLVRGSLEHRGNRKCAKMHGVA